MKPNVWISQLEFSDGTIIDLGPDDIVVMVGPNNAGKSVSLKEIASVTHRFTPATVVLKRITLSKNGSAEELITYFEETSVKRFHGNPDPTYEGYRFQIYKPAISVRWPTAETRGLDDLHPFFVHHLSTEDRLSAASPPKSINLLSDTASHPVHALQKNDELERKFSGFFQRAFGTDLTIHRNAGNVVPLYVGNTPKLNSGEDRVSASYLQRLEALDHLEGQGDGMRSFVGVLLEALVSDWAILLIDEPEAFLHPPQARLLGQMLVRERPTTGQLFLATHSEDFLKGLLDANSQNLKIVRIQREGIVNHVRLLDNAQIAEVWADSLLRHSNVLSGLFHTQVIVCESDSDCRFFSAVLSALHGDSENIAPDILFIHCGGKHRIPVVVKALKQLDVPIKVVSDFDIVNAENPLRKVYEELGGDWGNIQADWRQVKNAIDQKRPELQTADLKAEIDAIFLSISDSVFPQEQIDEIKAKLRKASAWTEAKKVGKVYLPNGQPTQAFERLQTFLKAHGLLVLEVGEIEGFVRSVGNHGPRWVAQALAKDLTADPELEIARQFVRQLIR